MKIGIDIREFSKNNTEIFLGILKEIKKDKSSNIFNIYHNNKNLDFTNTNNNLILKHVNAKSISLKEQTVFLKVLMDDKNDLTIFFDDTRPLFYKGKSVQIIKSLKNLLYPNLVYSKFFKKYPYLYILKKSLKKSDKIITFDEKTKTNINEKLNIDEEKIYCLNPFFIKYDDGDSSTDIKQKHSLLGEYLVYDTGIGNNKNIQKTLEVLKEINKNKDKKIYLFLLGNDIANDSETRQIVINLGINEYCYFIGDIPKNELSLYYKQSIGTIFPSLYSSFPFSLSKSLSFGSRIIAHNSEENKDIFSDKIKYFSGLSKNDMIVNLEKFIKEENKKVDYTDIFAKYSSRNFLINLSKEI